MRSIKLAKIQNGWWKVQQAEERWTMERDILGKDILGGESAADGMRCSRSNKIYDSGIKNRRFTKSHPNLLNHTPILLNQTPPIN